MARIFISYKRADKEKVFKIKDQIEAALGEKCWIDIDGIESDAQFKNIIINAINDSEIVLFMYSNTHSTIIDFDNDWTVRELNFARLKKKRVVFINIDGSPLSDIFAFDYGTQQQVDARSNNQIKKLIDDILRWLGTKIENVNPNLIGEQSYENVYQKVGGIPNLPTMRKGGGQIVETYKVQNVEFNMVHIKGGTFRMGEVSDAHQVTLSDYLCGETPVTQDLWQMVMGGNPSQFKNRNCPVENVSWYDCMDFIDRLNQMTGHSFRLLTEAEWEYAARGGCRSKGYLFSGSNVLDEVAWYDLNSSKTTHDVKCKKANELGIYDMTGNVSEWCQDWYGVYKKHAQENPNGPNDGVRRVFRGGCFYNSDVRSTVYYRDCSYPDYVSNRLGFRIAL